MIRPPRCIFETALDFVGTYQFLRLFLGAPHNLWVVTWVVRQHNCEFCLFHVLLVHHRQHKVSMLAFSEVRRHGRRIPTYKSMYLDQFFSCRFSSNIWKDGRQEIREDSLDAAHLPRHFVSHSCWDRRRVRPLGKFV